jgi:hypothetical protein
MKALGWAVVVLCASCGSEEPLATGQDRGSSSRARDAGGDDDPEADAATPDSVDAGASDTVAGSSASGGDTTGLADSNPCALTDVARAERCDGFDDSRPDRVSEHAAVYDPARLQMVVTGGTPDIPVNCTSDGTKEFYAETWIYDDPCGQWKLGADMPSPRGRHVAAWVDGSVWVFGGRFRAEDSGNYTLFNDLLRYDVAADDWSVETAGGSLPRARANAAITWDSRRNRLWLFGGNVSISGVVYQPLDDLWSFDLDTRVWEQSSTAVAPPPRLFHSMAYDAQRDWLVVFGGANETAFADVPLYFGDLWAYDLEQGSWIELAPQGAGPIGRFWSTLVVDTTTDTYVTFGGHDPADLGNRNDVWRFDPNSGSWQEPAQGDVFNTEANGFCNFPPDFATVDPETPERRSAHTFVWSESCGHALLFAGKTDCGSTDDVWSLSSEGWTEVVPAREGEVCHRWRDDPDRCTDICF